MKRYFLILFAGIVGIAIIFFRPKQSINNESGVLHGSTVTNAPVVIEITNSLSIKETPEPIQTNIFQPEPKKILDGIKMRSLADWTNAIPYIKQWSEFRGRSSWVAAPMDTNSYPVILLTGVNGNTVQFTAKLTDVEARDDHVRTIELHTPDMNIEEIRKFGKQLCELQGLDATDFLAWCDKVGNQWVDAPLYDGNSLPLPNSNKFYGFGILRAYNNEKPWCINFFITDK